MGAEKKRYIGFVARFAAFSIDIIIVFFLISFLINKLVIYSPLPLFRGWLIGMGIVILLFILYEIYFVHKFGGTIGKLLLGIRVVNKENLNPSITDSITRHFSKWLSAITLGIGYLIIIWDKDKQALHDKIAETYVIDTPKRKIKESVRVSITVLIITIVIAYLYFIIAIFVMAFTISLQSETEEIESKDTLNVVFSKCNSTIPFYKDICLEVYSEKILVKNFDINTKLEFCSKISSKSRHMGCIAEMAIYEENVSLCSNSKSMFLERTCRKTYNSTISIVEHFYPEEELKFNGTLNVGEVKFGLLIGQKCIEVEDFEFLPEDYFCFEVYNVTGFEKGKDGLNWYDIAVKKYENENLIDDDKEIYGKDGHVDLKDGLLNSAGMNSRLNETIPGIYLYQVAIYDKISMKGNYFNKTIEVIEKPEGSLSIEDTALGVITSGENCATKHEYIYTNKDTACIKVFNVGKFEKTKDGFNLLEMNLFIKNSSGNIVEGWKNIWEEDGILVLRNNIFNAHDEFPFGVSQFLGTLVPGEYTFELVVKDRIGKKQAKTFKNFRIVDNKTPLKVEKYTLGYYDGYNCIERRSKIFSNQEIVCLMPYISGFEEDSDGYMYFNMDHMILDSQGDKVSFFENAFEKEDEKTDSPLTDSFVYTPLYDLPLGEYVYEVKIKDLISKETVTITADFSIQDIKYNLY